MKNKSLYISILILLICSTGALASDKGKLRFTGGLEWGYSLSSSLYRHYNFDSSISGRIDIKDHKLNIDSNGYLSGNVGIKFLNHCSFIFSGGFYGLQSDRRSTVATGKFLYYFKGYDFDSAIVFIEGGKGFAPCMPDKGIFLGKLGGGYQFELSNWIRLQLMASIQFITDHPDSFYDIVEKKTITPPELRRSDCYYAALNVGIGLNF